MKRKFALILAFIMMAQLIAVADFAEVNAADATTLVSAYDQILKPGAASATPVLTTTNADSDQVLLSWNFARMGNTDFSEGVIRLWYYADNGKVVLFEITKTDSDRAVVTYDVLRGTGEFKSKEWPPADPDNYPWKSVIPSQSNGYYGIYTDKTERYEKLADFIARYNMADQNYQVVDTTSGSTITDPPGKPEFIIKPDTGFSFQYDSNKTVHFLWVNNLIYLTTNQIKPGRIYDFHLEGNLGDEYDQQDSSYWYFDRKYLNGIDMDTFRSIPLANSRNASGAAIEPVTAVNGSVVKGSPMSPPLDQKVDSDDSTINGLVRALIRPNEDAPAGSDVHELLLRFDIPVEYDPIANSFSREPTDKFTMNIETDCRVEKWKGMQVKIEDISDGTTRSGTASNGTPWKYSTVNTDSMRREVRLTGLEAGLIFDNVKFSFTEGPGQQRTTNLTGGKVFTFLKYDLLFQDNMTYIKITPYQGKYSGAYLLKNGSAYPPQENSILQNSDGVSEVYMPVSIGQGATKRFQVFFAYDEKSFANYNTDGALYSQVVEYTAHNALSLGSVKNFNVLEDKTRVYPTDNGDEAKLDFTVQWDMANESVFKSLLASKDPVTITYQINKSLTPDSAAASFGEYALIDIEVTSGSSLSVDSFSYSVPDGSPIKNVTFKQKNDYSSGNNDPVWYIEVEFETVTGSQGTYDFIYPNVYFLNAKPILLNGSNPQIGGSLFDSLTINGPYAPEVSPPQNLSAHDPKINNTVPDKELSFKLSWDWPVSKLTEYFDNAYIDPKDASKIGVNANIYIVQDSALAGQGESYMKNQFGKFDLAQRVSNSVSSTYTQEDTNTVYFSDLNGSGVPVISNALTSLRNGKVVQVNGIKLSNSEINALIQGGTTSSQSVTYTLDGLDQNQKYYVYADIVVTHGPNNYAPDGSASKLSSLVGITTPSDKDVPTGEEKVPPAPMNLDKENVDVSQATITWTCDAKPTEPGETIEFEIIRVKDKQLSQMDAGNTPFEDYYANVIPSGTEKAGWRTNGTGLELYNGSSFSTADASKYIYDSSGNPYKLTDRMLLPNQLYFYYVRTVRVVNGVRIRSSWSAVSVTTTPVKSPKNLKAETGRTDYDLKTEMIISFDAPLTSLDSLGTDYNLQYQLKEDSGEWSAPVTMNVSSLKSSATQSSDPDYYHFIYKLTGMKHNTLYSVRVRMIDANGDGSLYTNIITFKTDIDQGEYDDEKKQEDWLSFLKEQLDKIVKDPYWVSRETSAEMEVIYRPSRFNELMSTSIDGTLTLVQSKAQKATYYLPASSVISANNAGKGFKISNDEMDIILSSGAVDTDYNNAIIEISNRIKTKSISDYFLKISVTWSEYGGQVEGNEPLSQQATVVFEVVGTTKNIATWDGELMEELSKEIMNIAESDGMANTLKNMISNGTISEDMVKYVQNSISAVKNSLTSKIYEKQRGILSGSIALSRLDSTMIIAAKGLEQDAAVSGYQYIDGVWFVKDVADFGGGKAIYTDTPGVYIFAGIVISIPGLVGEPGEGSITAIVAKYRLDDFFGKGDAFDIESNASRYAVISSIARMAGAPKGSDAASWLKSNMGITISGRNLNGDIQTQEAIHMVMLLYEVKTNTKISTIKIRNYNQTAGIAGIDDSYKQSVRAAFEVGIYSNKSMTPRGGIKVREVLDMLYILDGKKKL